MKRNEVLRPLPGQTWHHVPTFDDLVEGIYEAPPFKPKAYEYLRILNSPAIQQLIGNSNLAAAAGEREAHMRQQEAVLQSVAHESGMDVRTIREMHERSIASGEIDGSTWHPPPFSQRPQSEPSGPDEPPPPHIPPPPPKPRQPPGGGASAVRSPSRPIFQFGGSSGSGNGPPGAGASSRIKTPPHMPEGGIPEVLGPRGPPPGPGPSGAAQAAVVAAHNKVGEKGREAKEVLDRLDEMTREHHKEYTKIATAPLARGSTHTSATETLHRSIPIPKGLVHYEDPEDLEAAAVEIEHEQHARASAFVDGVELSPPPGGRRKKVLVQDVPQPHPEPMNIDVLAHALIHQAGSMKELL